MGSPHLRSLGQMCPPSRTRADQKPVSPEAFIDTRSSPAPTVDNEADRAPNMSGYILTRAGQPKTETRVEPAANVRRWAGSNRRETEVRMKTAMLCVALAAVSANTGPLTFEVASVKVANGPNGVTGGCHGIDSVYGPSQREGSPPLGRCVIRDARCGRTLSPPRQFLPGGGPRSKLAACVAFPRLASDSKTGARLVGILERIRDTLGETPDAAVLSVSVA